jgi:tRNA-specific 2-thiouridylase
VVVGSVDDLVVGTVEADRAVWFVEDTGASFDCALQVRAHGTPVPARATVRDGVVEVVLGDTSLRGVAPGQSAVLYDGTRVLGQATVTAARRATAGAAR